MEDRFVLLSWALLLSTFVPHIVCHDIIGQRPPMGFNSWNAFGCDSRFNEETMRSIGDLLVDEGFRDVGYNYVVLDDCWMKPSREEGRLVFDPTRFPTGHTLGDFYQDKGLKFGIYSSASEYTCQRYPASLGYEADDAQQFAKWGVDFVKYDNCLTFPLWLLENSDDYVTRYLKMGQALNSTGRPMFYSLSVWGIHKPAIWAREFAHSWRTTHDILGFWWWIKTIATLNNQWAHASGPGGWNDPDMLEVGNGKLTEAQWKCHFSLWSMIKSPLLIGTDLRDATSAVKRILLNKDVIDLNQDELGVQATLKTSVAGEYEVWSGPLSGGDFAVLVLSHRRPQVRKGGLHPLAWVGQRYSKLKELAGLRTAGDHKVFVTHTEIGLPTSGSHHNAHGPSVTTAFNQTAAQPPNPNRPPNLYVVRDLWAKESLGHFPSNGRLPLRIDAEDCRVLRLVKQLTPSSKKKGNKKNEDPQTQPPSQPQAQPQPQAQAEAQAEAGKPQPALRGNVAPGPSAVAVTS